MYKIMMVISMFVRQFYLPNPFECFGEWAWLYNILAEPLMHSIAFGLVGLVYTRGSAPAIGSFLYLVAYTAVTGILTLMGVYSFAWWWVLIVLVGAIFICKLIGALGRWLSGETW